jgi:hypothetical protein
LASVARTCMRSRARVFMWTDIRPSSRDYKIGKMQASWYKLVIRQAQVRPIGRGLFGAYRSGTI